MNELYHFPDCSSPLDALVIAPHPDDAELGMGGTLAKLIRANWRIGILDLTSGEPTPYGTPENRRAETKIASEKLGVQWRYNLNLPNRSLEATIAHRQLLAEVFRLARPCWLFAPYWEDAHPDHLAATQLIEAARFWSKLTKTDMRGEPFHPQRIYYYYCVHLKMVPQPSFIVDISETWSAKRASIEAYATQFTIGREHVQPAFIDRLEDEASFWGKAIGVRYGEPFASREPIGMKDLDSLI